MLFIALLAIVALFLSIFYSTEFSISQFHLLMVSEKVSDGKYLYINIYDYLSPLPVYLNSYLSLTNQKSLLNSQILGFIILLFNSLYFNSIIDNYRLIEERTFVPGMLYLLLSSTIFTGFEFSSFLIATVFLNLAISTLLKVGLESADKVKHVFNSGIYIGFAFLCEQSMILFLFVGIVAVLYYSNSILKSIFTLFAGFTFPFIILLNFYLVNENHDVLLEYFIKSYFFGDSFLSIDIKSFTPWIFLSSISIMLYFTARTRFSFTNYISKGHQLFIVWFVTAIIILFFTKERTYSTIHIFIAPVAFLISFYFVNIRKKWFAELLTMIIILFSFTFNYLDVFNINKEGVFKSNIEAPIFDGNTLLFSNNIHFYSKNKHGSTFTNWELEKKKFLNISKKENLATVYCGIVDDYPKYIIDPDGIFERIMKVVPLFRDKYKKVDSKTYRLN